MNTLSRLDVLLANLLAPRRRSPVSRSSSYSPLSVPASPPPDDASSSAGPSSIPRPGSSDASSSPAASPRAVAGLNSALSTSSSSTSISSLTTHPRLSNLPPTPRKRRPGTGTRRRFVPSSTSTAIFPATSASTSTAPSSSYTGISESLLHPTISSIQLPPPSTPFLLRIALALWAILLAFWRSLVGETRAERRRRRGRGARGRLRGGRAGTIGAPGVIGADAKVLLGAQPGQLGGQIPAPLGVQLGQLDGEYAGQLGAQLGDQGNETDAERSSGGPTGRDAANAVVEEEEEADAVEYTDKDKAKQEDRRNAGAFTFRLRSASREKLDQVDEGSGGAGSGSGDMASDGGVGTKATPFVRSPNPTSILSNPLTRHANGKGTSSSSPSSPSSPTTSESCGKLDGNGMTDFSDTHPPPSQPVQRRQNRLLPNPMSTSLLDPTLPAQSASFRAASPAQRRAPAPTPFHLQKTLILDLDETLIHSTSRPLSYAASAGGGLLGLSFGGLLGGKGRRREGHTVEVVLGGRSTTYHVYKRPYVDHFLKKVASWYTLVIFTASMPEYADPVIDWLDGGRGLFAKKLYRESCHLQPNGSYIKDLALVEADLSRVCFMDNSPVSYSWNKANALPVEGWTSDPSDEALLHSIPVLDSLRFVNDVRRVLGIRGFS